MKNYLTDIVGLPSGQIIEISNHTELKLLLSRNLVFTNTELYIEQGIYFFDDKNYDTIIKLLISMS